MHTDSASFDAEELLSHILDKPRSFLFAFNEQLLSEQQTLQFQAFIKRAQAGEPIAYIIGYRGFWDLELQVTSDVLIPRPDTEILVETLLKRLPKNDKINILDLGTGSGAIALALKSSLPKADIFALDFSFKALQVCQHNCQITQLAVPLIHSSWLDAIKHHSLDIIVSNPPYIDAADTHLSGLTYEPYRALVAGDKGLADYQAICSQAASKLTPQGMLIFEHGFDQAQAVSTIMAEADFIRIETIKDYGNNDRVTLGYRGATTC